MVRRHKLVLRDNIQGLHKGLRRLLKAVRADMNEPKLRVQKDVAEHLANALESHIKALAKNALIHAEHNRRKTIALEDVQAAAKKKIVADEAALVTQRVPFVRYVRELLQKEGDVRMSKEAAIGIQTVFEHLAERMIRFLVKHAKHMKRNTILKDDVKLLLKVKAELCALCGIVGAVKVSMERKERKAAVRAKVAKKLKSLKKKSSAKKAKKSSPKKKSSTKKTKSPKRK